jgi:hypothetical protein
MAYRRSSTAMMNSQPSLTLARLAGKIAWSRGLRSDGIATLCHSPEGVGRSRLRLAESGDLLANNRRPTQVEPDVAAAMLTLFVHFQGLDLISGLESPVHFLFTLTRWIRLRGISSPLGPQLACHFLS